MSKQVLRSGTAIGAADFTSKLSIAFKEANETLYWLNLLKDSEYLESNMFESIKPDIEELIKLLVASINTAKKNNR